MKNSRSRKLAAVISVVLALTLVLGATPLASFAASEETESSKLVDMFYKDIVDEYYDDVYAVVYKQAVKQGLIDDAIAEIDKLIAQIKEAEAQIPDDVPEEIPEELPEDWPEEIPEDWAEQIPQDVLDKLPEGLLDELLDKYGKGEKGSVVYSVRSGESNSYTEYVAYIIKLREEIDLALDTLNEVKAILAGDDLTTFEGLVEAVDDLQATLPERIDRIELLWIFLAEDPNNQIDPDTILEALETLEKVEYELEHTVAPALDAALEAVAAEVYDPACTLLGVFLEKEINSAEELKEAFGVVAGMSEEEIKQQIDKLVYQATHADYKIDDDSCYVAFGNIYTRGSYAELLAERLDVKLVDHSQSGMTIEQMAANVSAYKADIQKADLITLNFGETNSFLSVVNNMIASEADYDIHWETYFGEGAAKTEAEIDETLEKLYAELTANDLDGKFAEALVGAVEYYLYQCVAHAYNLDKLVGEIEAINPDALIVVVGAYNPLRDTTYNHEGTVIEFGAYLDYLFDALGMFDLTYAIITDSITYVDAPDVAIQLSGKELDTDLIADLNAVTVMPSADGNTYIQQKIWEALNITVDKDDDNEDPENPDDPEDKCQHQFGDWTEVKGADCKEKGQEKRVCTKCGEPEYRDIDKLPHQFGDWTEVKKTSCKEKGQEKRVCTKCGEPEYRDIEKLAHDWHWVIDEKPTVEKTGLKHEECKLCGEKRNEGTVIPKLQVTPGTGEMLTSDMFIAIVLLAVLSGTTVGLLVFKRKRFG